MAFRAPAGLRLRPSVTFLALAGCTVLTGFFLGPPSVPTDIQLPGTQPLETTILPATNCDNCHGSYDPAIEPSDQWSGSMMAHASRDPVFWAALAIAEQDYAGSGDLCLRCHVPMGWMAGRSVPTDGSAMLNSDAEGVTCHVCHKLTNPDQSEHLGEQYGDFVANDGAPTPNGYYGAGQYVLWGGDERLGPYDDAASPHLSIQSAYHRSPQLCGTCHDVSNPMVGDLAHNNGAQIPLAPGTFSGVPGAPVSQKAAFNNFPHQYGVIERTFSEHAASALSQTLVADYTTLPAELQAGVLQDAYDAALATGNGGDYADGTPRTFSCQTCHMQPANGAGCDFGSPPTRSDLPRHDLTGGNYWAPDAMEYLNGLGKLRLGGGSYSSKPVAAGKSRALWNLTRAAKLEVDGDQLRVINLTGHKLITGYPEGRRMWLNVKWYDAQGNVVREDGEYGEITANIDGTPTQVETILDLDDPNLRIYHAELGMTQEWASQLIGFGLSSSLPLAFDRASGSVTDTLGSLAAQAPGTSLPTFHFILNNTVRSDTRIPPYGYDRDEAQTRNALPVPATQFGNPGPGGTYDYWDEVQLVPPPLGVHAEIELLYQPTSWEYIQFLHEANDGSNVFLADEGADLLDAWLNTGMAAPEVMATATWSDPDLFTAFCFGDGSGTACPCGAGDGGHGCDNAQGTGGVELSGTGFPAFNTVVLHGSGFPTSSSPTVIVMRSPNAQSPALAFGDGLLCVQPPIVRFGATFAVGGASTHTINHGAGPGTFRYQLWYRNNPAGFCTPSAFNTSNGLAITWP